MPGIIGYSLTASVAASDVNTLDRMLAAVRHEACYQETRGSSRQGHFACLHLGLAAHELLAQTPTGEVGALLDGWLYEAGDFRNKGDRDIVSVCLNLYLTEGLSFVPHLNGQFNLLIWDDRVSKIYLINDRYGLRPLQYACIDGTLYFAPEGKGIIAADNSRAKLNLDTLVCYLSYGRIFSGSSTFFEGIELLPPASILEFSQGRLDCSQYWDYVYEPVGEVGEDFVEELVAEFVSATARQMHHPLRYGVSLSGGLDSRSVLAAALRTGTQQVRAYSWGMAENNQENDIAHEVANHVDVPFHLIRLLPAAFIQNAAHGVKLSEGLDLFVQSYGLTVYPQIRQEVDGLITGLALDVSLGGSYLTRELVENTLSPGQARGQLLDNMAYFSEEECKALLKLSDVNERLEGLRAQFRQDWENCVNDRTADQSDRFVLRSRGRVLFARQAWQRYFLEDVIPTFDNHFVDLILQIPPKYRFQHRIYRDFLKKLAPSLMEIPYQRTLLPPSVPTQFWPEAMSLEIRREALLREIWSHTSGQVFIPYRRYSTNYDEWLRLDPQWRALIENLLLSDRSRACDMYLDREFVSRIVADQQNGRTGHHHILNLITIELLLRQWF